MDLFLTNAYLTDLFMLLFMRDYLLYFFTNKFLIQILVCFGACWG